MTDGEGAVVTLEPVGPADAPLIFECWGRRPENFTHLTARVFAGVSDAEAYIAGLFQTPESCAFHIVEPGGEIVGIIKANQLTLRSE